MRYAVVFEKSEASFGAYVPDLPGCVAVGDSLAEAKSLIAQAMKQHLEVLRTQGHRPPEPASICAYIDA